VLAVDLTERKVEQGRLVSRLEALRARLAEQAHEQAEAARKLEESEAALAGQESKQRAAAEAIAALEAALKAQHEALEGLRAVERERRQAFDALAERQRALGEQARASQRAHEAGQARIHEVELKLTAERMRLEQHAAALEGLPARETPAQPAEGSAPPDERALERRLATAQAELQRMEGVNLGAPEEYDALNARLTLRSAGGQRTMAAEDFFVAALTTALAPDELLAEIALPPWPPRTGSSLLEVAKRHGDFALGGVAATLTLDAQGRVAGARLVCFGVGPRPVRVSDAERSLVGGAPSAAAFAEAGRLAAAGVDPSDDIHASGAYRKRLAGVLTARALAAALAAVGGRAA